MRRGALGSAAVLTLALWAASAPAAAEDAKIHCGSMAGYQPGSPWPAFKGCSTRLGQSKLMGPALSRNSLNFRSDDLGADALTPVVAADGTIYTPAGTRLYAHRNTGALAWSVELGGVFGILSAPAIGSDGTVYVASNMQLKALNPANGALRWAYDMSFGSLVISSVTIGPDRTIYIADQEGVVHAVTPSGTRKWAVDPSFLSRELINASPVLSADGRTVYIGTLGGKFYALDAATGQTRWTSPINLGDTATAAVGEDGTIYVASALGLLYALSPADGSRLWETLVDLPFVPSSALTAAPALTPQGTIVVGTLGGKLVNIDRGGRILWSTKLCSYFVSSPTVDAGGTIYIGDNVGVMRAIDSRTGSVLWSYTTGGEIWATPAIGLAGEVIFGSNDNRLYSIGKNNTLVLVREPRVPISVPTFPDGTTGSNPTPSMQIQAPYCGVAMVPGQRRPGITYTERVASPGVEYIENVVLADTTDPDCNAHLCSSEEVRLPATDEQRLLSAPSGRMPAGATDTCDAVEAPARCPMKRNGVDYTRTCTPTAGCGAGKICALACPQMPGSPGRALDTCPVEQLANYCVTLETSRCGGLTGAENPDPVRGIMDCHEVRECARDDDKITQAEAVPTCGGDRSCDFTTTAMAPARTGENTTSYPAMNLWTAPSNVMCQLKQPELATSVQNGGSPDGANSGGHKKQKKWGIRAYANVSGNAGLEPLPFGLFVPNARALGKIGVEGTIMGNTIKVVEIGGDAKLGKCSITASGGLTLFGQQIDAYSRKIPGYTDTSGACAAFFKGLEYASGPIKNNLYQAARMALSAKEQAERVSQGLQSQVIVTRAMCEAALGRGNAECDPATYQGQAAAFAQLPAKVANTYIDRYNTAVDQLQYRIDKARNELLGGANGYLNQLRAAQLDIAERSGFSAVIPLAPLREKRSFAAAAAHFPIGPLTLSLEIEGYTTWGAEGNLSYGVRFFPDGSKLPGAWASASVAPAAGLYVDVFLGVGFEFGIAGASAGIGGDIMLAEIKAPVSGTLSAEMKEVALPETRPLPSELQAFAGNGFRLTPKRYRFSVGGGLGAGITFSALKGNVDVRLRVRFLFFSKTWKKRFAKFEGFTKSYMWTGQMSADGGSITSPVGLDAVNLEVMPTLSLPRIPAISPSIFTGYVPSVGWPTVNALPEGTIKSHLRTLETAAWPCEEPPGPI